MDKKLTILILEDNVTDAELMERALIRGELSFSSKRVETEEDFIKELEKNQPDIVLSDYTLPSYDGMSALEASKRHCPQVPFIFVSGTIGEEMAIKALKSGATDYVLKDKLHKLVSVVERALNEAVEHTRRKKAEAGLELSRERYALAQKVANIGSWDWDILTGELYWSEQIEPMFGFQKGKFGKSYTNFQNCIHPEDRKSVEDAVDACVKQDTPYDIEHRVVWPDGTIKWVAETGNTIRDKKGNAIRMLGIVRDITKRKQAEEMLRENEEKYRLLIENANDGIFIAQDNVTKFPNPRVLAMTQYSTEELAKMPFINLVHPKDRAMVLDRHIKRLKGRDAPSTYSFRIINNEGRELTVQLNVVSIIWEKRPATLNIIRDITPEKRLEAQFRKAQKMEAIGTLAGGIAHDFNNILSAIIGYTELAVDQISENDSIRSDLVGILKAGMRAKDLVAQILTVSRQNELNKYLNVKLHLIVKEALKLLRSSLPSTIEIHQEILDKGAILADPTQMHQVVMNLCTNAYQAMMEKGGTLDVKLSKVVLNANDINYLPGLKAGPYILLSVSDTGYGMGQTTLERIFDPYFTTKEKERGTGLGLAVVHGIVDNHKGIIKVYSELNKGTTFHVYFPRIKGHVAEKIETLKPAPGGNESILYVDDEESIIKIVKRMMRDLGYDIKTATDSMDALEIFKKNPDKFDLVITDMTMPKMTGDKLVQKLMQIRPDIPVILCTGLSTKATRNKALKIGIKIFLIKPFVKIDLAKAIRKALDK